MPPAPSEPEKYSIDEMLERLKGKNSGDPAIDGELVVRADGTQAIRVRKHKRRTQQPQREAAKRLRRTRMIQATFALVSLLLIGLLIGGAYVYSNTAPYRKSITDALSGATGATVDFKLFRVSPASANAEYVELTWPDGNALKSLQLRGVTADIALLSLFGSSLHGDEVIAREATLTLKPPVSNSQVVVADSSNKMPVAFTRVSVPKFDVIIGDPTQPVFRIASTDASLRLVNDMNETSLHLYRGDLQFIGWPTYHIDRAIMEFHGKEANLIALRISDSQPKHGLLELSGTVRPFATDSPTTLSVKLDNFDLGELLGSDFGELISAKVDTLAVANSNFLSFTAGSRSSVNLDIAFKSTVSSKVGIKGFPFLLSLIRTLNDKWYETPSFVEDATGTLHRNSNSVEIRDLKLESKSRMAIRASLAAANDKSLTGTMQVGIPESVAELAQNGKINSLLSPPRDGFRWFTLKISGTLARPSDNFSELYAAAKDATADEPADKETGGQNPPSSSSVPAAPKPDLEKAFDNVTRPTGP